MALDPWHVRISHHTLERYMERRGWAKSYAYTQDAEQTIRNLLARVAHKNPPVKVKNGKASRLYEVGQFGFVVSTDNSTVITCYPRTVEGAQARRRGHRAAVKARRAAAWA